MKSIAIKIGLAVLLTYFGYKLTDKGLSSPSDRTLTEYEKLCNQSVKTEGVLDSTYSEMKIKLLRGTDGTKFNNFGYTYKVGDQTYSGKFAIKGLPEKLSVDVWYDPSNPSSHLTNDPCKQLEFSKAKKYPSWYSFLGVPMLLIGVTLLIGSFKSGIRTIFGTNKSSRNANS